MRGYVDWQDPAMEHETDAKMRALPNHRDSHLLFSFWIMLDAVGIL